MKFNKRIVALSLLLLQSVAVNGANGAAQGALGALANATPGQVGMVGGGFFAGLVAGRLLGGSTKDEQARADIALLKRIVQKNHAALGNPANRDENGFFEFFTLIPDAEQTTAVWVRTKAVPAHDDNVAVDAGEWELQYLTDEQQAEQGATHDVKIAHCDYPNAGGQGQMVPPDVHGNLAEVLPGYTRQQCRSITHEERRATMLEALKSTTQLAWDANGRASQLERQLWQLQQRMQALQQGGQGTVDLEALTAQVVGHRAMADLLKGVEQRMTQHMDEGFGRVSGRLDAMDARLGPLENQVAALGGLDTKIELLDGRVTTLEEDYDEGADAFDDAPPPPADGDNGEEDDTDLGSPPPPPADGDNGDEDAGNDADDDDGNSGDDEK